MKLKLPLGAPFPTLRSLRNEYRTAASFRAAGVRAVSKNTDLKQKDTRAATRIEKANVGKLLAVFSAVGQALPMIRFGARPTATGVTFKIGAEKRSLRSASIAQLASDHIGVFLRRGAKVKPTRGAFAGRTIRRGPRRGQPILQQPVEEQFGPSIPGAFQDGEVQSEMERRPREWFPIEFRAALRATQERHGKKDAGGPWHPARSRINELARNR